jgi:predicted TIM-barrel fold metal-dependent hydrolase
MKTIALEEHFVSRGFLAGPGKEFTEQIRGRGVRGARIYEQLQEIGDQRIAEMDAAGIDMQVLSLNAPGIEQAEAAEQLAISVESNDFIAASMAKNATRFAAFASLPTAAPDKAVEELEYRVRQQGFKGALINGHTRGRYLDDQSSGQFWTVPKR